MKRRSAKLGLICFVLLCSVLVFAQADQDTVQHAATALRANQYNDALQFLKPALVKFPKDARLWTMQGMAFSGNHRSDQALAAYRHALTVSPQYLPALEGAAQIEYEKGGKDAASLLQRVLTLRPDDPTSHAMLGSLAYKQGNCSSAVQNFEQSGTILDSQPLSLQQYGACLEKLRQLDKAIAVFQRLLNLNADDSKTRFHVASLELRADHPTDALGTLQPLLRSNPETRVSELAAAAYEASGNTPLAIATLKQAMLQYPENVDLYVDFAGIAFDHGSYAAGIAMMDAGLSAHPNAAALYLERGILYVQIADYEKAEADFDKASQLDPHQSLSGAAKGKIAEQTGDYAKALATVQAKLAKNPEDAFLLYTRAEILVQKGVSPGTAEFRLAIESARKAVALQPSLILAHDILGSLYLENEQAELSAEQSRQALQIDPKDQTALYHLILVLRRTKGNQELPELLKRLAQLRQQSTRALSSQNAEK
jgi:tetratricopeptide (TPR) repeat protein